MDIRQLRYFLAIVEQGSFSRAARALNVAQPALSLHVRNMEAALGTPLLFRTARGVEATEAGAILARHARVIVDQITAAEEEVRGHHDDPSGEVKLGVPGTIGQILAVPLISAAHLRYPNIRLRIAEAMSGFILEWIRDERIDLAVLYGQQTEHAIRTERLLEENLHFFGSGTAAPDAGLPQAERPVDFVSALGLPLILPGQGHGLRDLLDRQAAAGSATLTTVIDVDSYANIKSLVAEGLGYSILPENAIAAEVAQGALRQWSLCNPPITRTIHLAHSAKRPVTNAVRAILDLTRETLNELASSGRWIGARRSEDMEKAPD